MINKNFPLSYLASFVAFAVSLSATASVFRDDIDLQYYRDFAENKGKFTVGASNIEIKDKSGNTLDALFPNVPMPDFSAANRNLGIATLVAPQYLVSVAHNTQYNTVEFGAPGTNADAHHYTYKVVDRNDYGIVEGGQHQDYQVPRLNKLVTEVAPATVTDLGNNASAYQDSSRFTHFARLGSGRQIVKNTEHKDNQISTSYQYLTGGVHLPIAVHNSDYWLDFRGNALNNSPYGALTAFGTRGDSGSGVYGYDQKTKRWLLLATYTFGTPANNYYNRAGIIRQDYHDKQFAEDIAGTLTNAQQNAVFEWSAQGKDSRIGNKGKNLTVSLADRSIKDNSASPLGYGGTPQLQLPQDNTGKTLNIEGQDSTIVLKTDIDQGAGALNFNANATVRPENDQSWVGAGIVVAKGKQVNWQVKNPQGDRLSKLGEGTLHINGKGENLGDISVGQGTVILNQQAGENGKKSAFNQVGIVSGRSTVVLNSADQVDPNKIYFGFRGGRLDLNGNNIAFNRIQNSDDGARIVNNHLQKAATLTINGPKAPEATDLKWGTWKENGADIYEYINPHANNRTDYFTLKGNPNQYMPTNGASNAHWTFLSSNKDAAVKQVLAQKGLEHRYNSFNGFIGETDNTQHNGRLNVVYDPKASTPPATASEVTWGKGLVAGADIYQFTNPKTKIREYFALKGDPKQPVPRGGLSSEHWEFLAADRNQAINKVLARKNAPIEQEKLNSIYTFSGGLNLNGDLTVKGGKVLLSGRPTPHAYDVINKQDVVYADDWQNRQFKADNMQLNQYAQLYVGRNVSNLQANLAANDHAQLHLGFINGQTPSCYYSEYTGKTSCDTQAVVSDEIFATLPTTQINGDVSLAEQSQLHIGKANLIGTIQAAATTSIRLANQASWTNTGDSRTGNLVAENGSTINLNEKFVTGEIPTRFNTLIIDGNFQGNAKINYLTDIAAGKGDHLQVNGLAEGTFTLALRNSGKEAEVVSPLSLLTLTHQAQADKAKVSLENGYVDLGAYRYVLVNRSNDYRLYNPLKDAKDRNQSIATAKAELDHAIAEADKQKQEISRLNAEAEKERQAEKNAKQAAANAQSQLSQANSELTRLQQYADYYRRYYPTYYRQIQGQITVAKQKVTQASAALTTAENNAKAAAAQIANVEQAVETAQNIAKQVEEKLATLRITAGNSEAILNAEALKLCQENGANCEHLQAHADTDDNAIHQSDWVSQYANTALSELSAQANSALQIGQGLDRQLFAKHDKFHVWSSIEHQKTEHKSDLYRPYEQQTNLTQLGVELPLANGINAGVVLSRNHANTEFDEGVNGKSNLLMASLYGKWHSENGTFVSLDGSYGKAKNRIDLFGENRFNRHIMAIGANLGHNFDLAGVQVQPAVGTRYYRFNAQDYKLGEVEVRSPKANFMAYQAGVKVSKAFDLSGWKVEPSLAAHYVDASSKRLSVAVNDNTFSQRFGRYLKTEVGVGVTKGQWQLSTHLGLLKGNEIGKQHFAGFKLGYSW